MRLCVVCCVVSALQGLCCVPQRNSRFRLLEAECRKAIDVGVARRQKEMGLGEKTPKVTTIKQVGPHGYPHKGVCCAAVEGSGSRTGR